MNHVDEAIRQIGLAVDDAMKQIAQAAAEKNLPALEQKTRYASELRGTQDRLRGLASIFQMALPKAGGTPTTAALRELIVVVTQGMINQNLLLLTEHIKRGVVRVGENMLIETFPSKDRFRTDLATGNKLRERGRIGKFYKDADIHAGDAIILIEIAPGDWQLKKKG